jgi:dethiobiotin synthetase
MPALYGYVLKTEANDGDHVDVYVGDAHTSKRVWVVNQIDPAMPHQAANIEALRELLSAPCLGSLPWMSVPSAALAVDALDFSQLAYWPK